MQSKIENNVLTLTTELRPNDFVRLENSIHTLMTDVINLNGIAQYHAIECDVNPGHYILFRLGDIQADHLLHGHLSESKKSNERVIRESSFPVTLMSVNVEWMIEPMLIVKAAIHGNFQDGELNG